MAIDIFEKLEQLIQYGVNKELISPLDMDYTRNRLLEVLGLDDAEARTVSGDSDLEDILMPMLDWAVETGLIPDGTDTYRDLLDAKIMGCLVAPPSVIYAKFEEKRKHCGPKAATSWFYEMQQHAHYIHTGRIAKNVQWFTPTEDGELEITINLSKPEKDPKAIAEAKQLSQKQYPLCLLCKENVGFGGRINHPARQNHRIIPVTLTNESWFMQFSPYVYYNEHCIVFKGEHEPMQISKKTFERLLSFISIYPHYFIGSNADLPIVGGSILSHDHFQGGAHEFPMAKAKMEEVFSLEKFPRVKAGIVKWPMSVIRLQSSDQQTLAEAADFILHEWKMYSDPEAGLFSHTGETPHNTITPIARRHGDEYELDLVLRNNRTDKQHPGGIFHPHKEVHHIKKENIGLIEVMGLAVLPGRLAEELSQLKAALLSKHPLEEIKACPSIMKHESWAERLIEENTFTKDNVEAILQKEIGLIFSRILAQAGVFKRTEQGKTAFKRFIQTLHTGR
ncbi:UDP-glucose--hexose-1-phosphate uridylyltransferase [Bacillus altitudinis]|uniref:UDP-glucose--hexose-1-phosphate uridylyltransferase n=1 Tax=Bacillus altitudinis TaxID=293387 RepID=UPI0011B365B3|nr:UDP-glucose--hexose-1-phosphate uridylyltransferase [Bacillus altitudinis]MCA1014734.1 UDP-glucose--hexose-1-phosphate uridylyltransferase [Bacillus stratosphericus]MDH8709339.1 UDPglucose--hexose-1-phosphate uridylyltransferase [Micromonospora sp. 1209]MCA2384632.1 UDP-glucose--hexose-1-phosphate uridylyltransferase [Bacillus stratosphericus]MCA2397604.1 UDP-glucose--hexose-1-phosphate uridylyltransferase [Bacillus stratosphericus]MEC1182307.1 UDP-glucose--hexose-1-phosphate uridylyltransf